MAMAGKVKKKYQIRLNSIPHLEELLQEMYEESCRNINEIQGELTRLSTSVDLNQEIMDSKVKYAKAINDYSTNKNKALATKMDIAKLMTEVIKFQGNLDEASREMESLPEDWNSFMGEIDARSKAKESAKDDAVEEYKLNINNDA